MLLTLHVLASLLSFQGYRVVRIAALHLLDSYVLYPEPVSAKVSLHFHTWAKCHTMGMGSGFVRSYQGTR